MTAAGVLNPEALQSSTRRNTLPFILYGMTGFTGLLAEQGLEKYITLLVGATATASAVVVFTYFLGFVIGGIVAAQLLKRGALRRPLKTYALLELLVGIACVLFSYLLASMIQTLAPLQNLASTEFGKYSVRFGCGCLLALPIAALMGASFPLIAQALNNERSAEPRDWSLAYSANLAGAVLAALSAPYFIIPAIGIRGAMWICLLICATVTAAVWFRAEPATVVRVMGPAPRPAPVDRDTLILLAGAFLSGAIFFALEIIWTHLIGTVIGGNVYAFSAMLFTVLTGLLIGSWLVNRPGAVRISFVLQLCALTLVIQLWMWDLAPVFFVIPPPVFYRTFFAREAYRLAVAALLIAPSATALGMIYPQLLRSPLASRDQKAWLAGYLGAANSAGCLTGSLLATFVLLPKAGAELSIKGAILTLAALFLIFKLREPEADLSSRMVPALAVAAFVLATIPRHWDWALLTSGASMYFGEATASRVAAPPGGERSIIFRDEQIQGGFTTVVEQKLPNGKTVRALYSNGKLQGNDDPAGDLPIQFGVAAIPALFATHFDHALLIGLGSGHTAAVLKELGFKELQIAELSPGIVRATDTAFRQMNRGVLEDPGVKLTLEDGRNWLLTSRGPKYDLITVELTAIWFAGATNLYSKEFYQLARGRLQPDAVLQQWVQLHRISPAEVSSAIATARSVFPYVSFWAYAGQGMLIASNHALTQPAGRNELLAERMSRAERLSIETARAYIEEVEDSQVVSQAGVDAMVGELTPVINTDHNRFIEYATPKYASSERDWRSYNLAFLKAWNR